MMNVTGPQIISVEQSKDIIPDEAIKIAFMAREDISVLPEAEREIRWKFHLVKVSQFRETLAKLPCYVVDSTGSFIDEEKENEAKP